MYADDAKLYAPITDRDSVSRVQDDLDALSEWCKTWRLRLNAQKCFLLHYVPQGRIAQVPQYQIDGTDLERKDKVTDLGIEINENLKFHDQVLKSCKKATNEINRIKRTFHSRSPEFLSSM